MLTSAPRKQSAEGDHLPEFDTANVPTPQQPHADVEGFHLSKVEAEFKQGMDCICQFLVPRRALTPEELVTIMNHLQALDNSLCRYHATCQQLGQPVFNELALRIGRMQNDLRGAITVYARMYHSALGNQRYLEQIWRQDSNERAQTVIGARKRRQQTYIDAYNKGFLVENGCP
jgi:hypothetical protein